MAQPQPSFYATYVPSQPLDKISLQHCHLYCFPSYLQFIKPYVNEFQAMDYRDEGTIKIFDVNFSSFLSFLQKCGEIYLNQQKPQDDMEQSTTVSDLTFGLSYSKTNSEFTLFIHDNLSRFEFKHFLIPHLISAVAKLIFKSYGYSNLINYLVSQFLKIAPITLLQNPTYSSCVSHFTSLDTPYIDFYLLFDIIERHKKVLAYLKLFHAFHK